MITTSAATPRASHTDTIRRMIDDTIIGRLSDCPYSFIFNQICWQLDGDRLTLRGRVPSFYLKQLLQELVRDIEHVRQTVNDVDVVNPRGISSTRPCRTRRRLAK